MKKKRKMIFEGWTAKGFGACWTYLNTFNLAAVVQKTKQEAAARYEDVRGHPNVQKVRITIEEIEG